MINLKQLRVKLLKFFELPFKDLFKLSIIIIWQWIYEVSKHTFGYKTKLLNSISDRNVIFF